MCIDVWEHSCEKSGSDPDVRFFKQAFRATLSAMLLTLSIARTIGYAAVNELTLDSFILCAAALPAMGIGLLVGDRIHTG
jgi:hypothetical protein